MKDEIKEILDYFRKYMSIDDCIRLSKIEDYITNLQEENERLKEENKRIFSKVNDDELLISNAMNYAEAQDYKSRNEKAIEYIENSNHDIIGRVCSFTKLINILRGNDNE